MLVFFGSDAKELLFWKRNRLLNRINWLLIVRTVEHIFTMQNGLLKLNKGECIRAGERDFRLLPTKKNKKKKRNVTN